MGKILWNWDNFTGGEADNSRLGPVGSFHYAEGVDVRRQPGEVTNGSALTDTGWVFADSILLIENLHQYGQNGILVACDDGKIYLDGVLKQTLSIGTNSHNRVIGVAYMNISGTDYLYYFTKTSFGTGKIHRSTLDLSTWDISYKEFQANSGAGNIVENISTISEPTRIIFGIGGRVFDIDNLEVVRLKLTLSNLEDVLGISVFQSQYRIYTNQNNQQTNQYFWDGYSIEYDYKIKWKGIPLQAIVNDGGYDYSIAGDSISSDFYQVAGSQRKEIRINKIGGIRKFYNHISTRQGLIYLSGSLSAEPGQEVNGIYVYGSFYPGQSKALILDYPLGVNKMLGHTHSAQISYFACSDNKVYKISNTSNNLNTTSYIKSLKYDGGIKYKYIKKAIDYAYIGFQGTSSTKTIKVYAKKDGGANSTFKLLKTIDNKHSSLMGIRVDKNEFKDLNLGDFFDLEYKVILNGTTTDTPIFRGIETYITTSISK